MHELIRRTYLESMGIDSYISRGQLPGAAPTKRLVIIPRTALPRVPEIAMTETSPKVAPAARASEPVPVAEPVRNQAQAFSVAIVAAGEWLWVEELSHGNLSRDQQQLIQAIVRALGLKGGNFNVSQFDWPIHTNKQLDLGEEAAQAGLGGFVQRKFDQLQCRGLILLGSASQQRLEKKLAGAEQCVSTVSTAQMLRDGQLKKQAWLDLLPIASRA